MTDLPHPERLAQVIDKPRMSRKWMRWGIPLSIASWLIMAGICAIIWFSLGVLG